VAGGGGGDLQLDAFLPSCLCVEPSLDSLFTVVFSASLLLIVFFFSIPSHLVVKLTHCAKETYGEILGLVIK
jgi:hypothetical protein